MNETSGNGLRRDRALNAGLIACIIMAGALVVLANVVVATLGIDSLRMIQAFSLDEGIAVERMRDSLERLSLDPDGFF